MLNNVILPFDINDGKTTRRAEMKDIILICELSLKYRLNSTKKKYWILRETEDPKVLVILYSAFKAILQLKLKYPLAYNGSINLVNSRQIHTIVCKELHKFNNNPLLDLMIEMELLK